VAAWPERGPRPAPARPPGSTRQNGCQPPWAAWGEAVSKHIADIFTKLDPYPGADANRRVLAVLTYLNT
jgi:hypothetical protein